MLLLIVRVALQVFLLLIAPGGPWSPWEHSLYAVGQCGPNGCVPRSVSYAPYGSTNWQPVVSQSQFRGATIIGQPVPVQTICGPSGCTVPAAVGQPCSETGCRNPLCTPGNCTNCPNCYYGGQAQWVSVGDRKWEKREGGKVTATWNEATRELKTLQAGDVLDPVPEEKAADPFQGKPTTGQAIEQKAELPAYMTSGVNQAETFGKGPRYLVNSKSIKPEQIEGGASSDPTLPDLKRKCLVTVTSKDPERRKAICEELKACSLGKECWVAAYAPDSWQLEGFKLPDDTEFQRTGEMVVLQEPAGADGFGKVLDKSYQYGTADAIQQQFSRKLNPNYKPNEPAGPDASPAGNRNLLYLLIGGLVLLGFVLLPQQQESGLQWSN